MAKASMVLAALLAVSCCITRPSAWQCSVEAILRDNPLAEDENIRVTDLAKTTAVSHHLVQVRHSEPLHIHRYHDFCALVYRGGGILVVGTNRSNVVAGNLAYVPKGVPHRFVNTSPEPSIAIVTFVPGLFKKDFEPIVVEE